MITTLLTILVGPLPKYLSLILACYPGRTREDSVIEGVVVDAKTGVNMIGIQRAVMKGTRA